MGRSNRVMGHYDKPMWESIANKAWALQYCADSDSFRYPPSPICPDSLSMDYEWRPIKGTGQILSWVIFHRTYFEDHKGPYNCVAVRLDEGPIVVSNLIEEPGEGEGWIGRRVEVVYEDNGEYILPKMRLV